MTAKFLVCQNELLNSDIEKYFTDYKGKVLDSNKLAVGIKFGISIDLGWKKNGSIRGFVSVSALQNLTTGSYKVLLGGQSELDIFRGGLGSSLLNENKSVINIEWRNSVMLLTGIDKNNPVYGKPGFVTVENETGALIDPLDYSFSLGTTFVNGINHKRNQQIGTVSISILQWLVQYYNDGPPFNILPFGDGYDRYWTGGGLIGFYFNNNNGFITDFVIRYDNYTGYQRNLYEVAGILKMDNLAYKNEEQQMFNQARFIYKVGVRNSFQLTYSVFEPKRTDIQYFIHHYLSHSPFHPRPLKRRHTFGANYKYILQ